MKHSLVIETIENEEEEMKNEKKWMYEKSRKERAKYRTKNVQLSAYVDIPVLNVTDTFASTVLRGNLRSSILDTLRVSMPGCGQQSESPPHGTVLRMHWRFLLLRHSIILTFYSWSGQRGKAASVIEAQAPW